MMQLKRSSFNVDIHGLRGFASMCVLLFHVYDMSRTGGIIPGDLPLAIRSIIMMTTCGVELFFMISGYLIMRSLLRSQSVKVFVIDRILRIYPVFLLLHVIGFTLGPIIKYKWMADITVIEWLKAFFSNLFFLPGLLNLPLLQLNVWTLSYEALFYTLSAVFFFFWQRSRIVSYAILLFILPPLFVTYPRAIFIFVGILIYFAINKWDVDFLHDRGVFFRRLCIFLFFICMGYTSATANDALLVFVIPLGAVLFADVAAGKSMLKKLLEQKPFQFFGTISYSLFLWHGFVGFGMRAFVTKVLIGQLGLSSGLAFFAFAILTLSVSITVGWMSWMFIEQKVGRWGKTKMVTWFGINAPTSV